jgi:hypothetical protein
MIDDKTVIVAFGRGRTAANLQENPNAVYTILEPGSGIMDWKGIRVYLSLREHVTSGPKLETYKRQAAEVIGKEAAEMVKTLATFEITEVRPLVDFGQGWERSI